MTKNITVDMARSLTDAAKVANQSAHVTSREARIATAKAAFAVRKSGAIGSGEGALWKSAEGFIAAADIRAERSGNLVGKSSLTSLERLGHALSTGWDPTASDKEVARWNALSAGDGTAMKDALGLDVTGLNVTKVRKFADSLIAVAAQKAATPGKRSPNSAGGKGKGEKDAPVVVLTDAQVLAKVRQMLTKVAEKDPSTVAALCTKVLGTTLAYLDDDLLTAIGEEVARKVTSVQKARAKDAAKAS